ncbi:hypothetical protein GCM10023339_02480 [Alloalcanivorax gelatiniphagus]
MLRPLVGCAIALALLLPAQATASAPSSAPDQRAAAAVTKSRTVGLGHEPVRASSRDRVRLTFTGKRGQLVHLARLDAADQCGGRTLRSGGTTVKPWAQGFWRLPRTATYTAINKPCRADRTSLKLQVRRVVREDRLTADATVTAGANTRVTHLVPFRVGDRERVSLSGTTFDLVHPDRSITPGIDGTDGYVVPDRSGRSTSDVASPRGRYFVELAPRASVSLGVWPVQPVSQQMEVPVTVDGPAVLVPRGEPGAANTALVFTGQQGQWVHVEQTSASGGSVEGGWWMTQLRDSSGNFPARVTAECPWTGQQGCTVTRLPATGTYMFDVFSGTSPEVSVRVRSAAVTTSATVNGPSVTYASTTPGRWVVGELPELPRDSSGESGATITLDNVSASLGDWRVTAVSGFGPCNPWVGMGCWGSLPSAFTLSPTTLTSPSPWDGFANPAVAVLTVPPRAQGSLDLTVTRPAE